MTQWLPSLSLLATGLGLTSGMKEHAAAASPDRAADARYPRRGRFPRGRAVVPGSAAVSARRAPDGCAACTAA